MGRGGREVRRKEMRGEEQTVRCRRLLSEEKTKLNDVSMMRKLRPTACLCFLFCVCTVLCFILTLIIHHVGLH